MGFLISFAGGGTSNGMTIGKKNPALTVVVNTINKVVVINKLSPSICKTCAQHKQPLTSPPKHKPTCSRKGNLKSLCIGLHNKHNPIIVIIRTIIIDDNIYKLNIILV